MLRKRVLITLPVDAYRRLAEMAEDEERVIDQQASLLLKLLLGNSQTSDRDPVVVESEGHCQELGQRPPALIQERKEGGLIS